MGGTGGNCGGAFGSPGTWMDLVKNLGLWIELRDKHCLAGVVMCLVGGLNWMDLWAEPAATSMSQLFKPTRMDSTATNFRFFFWILVKN